MSEYPFDLLVVGGGINGAGIARDAAGRGLRVLLVEADDRRATPRPPAPSWCTAAFATSNITSCGSFASR